MSVTAFDFRKLKVGDRLDWNASPLYVVAVTQVSAVGVTVRALSKEGAHLFSPQNWSYAEMASWVVSYGVPALTTATVRQAK